MLEGRFAEALGGAARSALPDFRHSKFWISIAVKRRGLMKTSAR